MKDSIELFELLYKVGYDPAFMQFSTSTQDFKVFCRSAVFDCPKYSTMIVLMSSL